MQPAYPEVKEDWEKTYMHVEDIDCCVRLRERYCEYSRAPTRLKGIELKSAGQEYAYYEKGANGQLIRKCFLTRWLRDDTKRTVQSIIFEPHTQPSPGFYNIFDGFAASKLPPAMNPFDIDDAMVMDIVHHVFAAGDPVRTEFILKWLARVVKTPMDPTRIALCFCGGDWEYKQIFFEFIIDHIIGRHYSATTSSIDYDLLDHFANSHHHKVLVCVKAMHKKSVDKVFTRETYEYITKGFRTPKTMPNYLNLVFTTDAAATAAMRQNQHLVVFDVVHTFDRPTCNLLRDACDDPLVAAAFYRRLMSIDVAGFVPHHAALVLRA
jgi:hypothetical protein